MSKLSDLTWPSVEVGEFKYATLIDEHGNVVAGFEFVDGQWVEISNPVVGIVITRDLKEIGLE